MISSSPGQAARWRRAPGTALREQTLDGSRPSRVLRLPIGRELKMEASDWSLGVLLLPREVDPVYILKLLISLKG